MRDCEVCRGRQTVRLPLYKPATVYFESAAVAVDVGDAYREYPCPECAPLVSKDQVRVVECHFQADTRHEHLEDYRRHLVETGVVRIADKIEELQFMRIQRTKENKHELKRGYRISVGVVPPRITASLDAERQTAEDAFAGRLVDLAIAEINNWGSFYGHADILKREAADLIGVALRRAKEERPR